MSDTNPLRPIPALTPATEFYWTAGQEGFLRFEKCTACNALVHPPMPMCPYCRNREFVITDSGGTGTVVGFTVNEHQLSTAFPPPSTVVVVAMDDDPRVRLTTNLVNADIDALFVGMRVRAVFEDHEDVSVPLFEPTGSREPGQLPEPNDDVTHWVRPPATSSKFEDKVVISGLGMSKVGRRQMVDPLSLTVDACVQAISDAGLSFDDIDGLSSYPGAGPVGRSEGGVTPLEETLRIRPTWISSGTETHGQIGAVTNAMLAVAAGLCRHVLVFRTVWEATYAELRRTGKLDDGVAPRAWDESQWRAPYGATRAVNSLAIKASNYFHRFGATRETLGWIALNGRKNAALNPLAVYRDPITMDDYLNARMISRPFGLYDCDVPCDGAVALIISAVETTPDLRRPPVRVEAVGTQIIDRISWDQDALTHMPQILGPAAHLWSRTDLCAGDVDVALLYDGFTFNALSWLEALGFCGIGEAKDFLDGGTRIALDGELPLNPHGGQLSAGRLHGYGGLHEAIRQVRGDAGAGQIDGASVAVVSAGGGVPGGVMLLRSPS